MLHFPMDTLTAIKLEIRQTQSERMYNPSGGRVALGKDPVPLADRFPGFPTDTANILRAENSIVPPVGNRD